MNLLHALLWRPTRPRQKRPCLTLNREGRTYSAVLSPDGIWLSSSGWKDGETAVPMVLQLGWYGNCVVTVWYRTTTQNHVEEKNRSVFSVQFHTHIKKGKERPTKIVTVSIGTPPVCSASYFCISIAFFFGVHGCTTDLFGHKDVRVCAHFFSRHLML